VGLLDGSMDFNSRSSTLEHCGLLLLASDGVVLLLSFNSRGEEIFSSHCLVSNLDDGVVLTWDRPSVLQLVLLFAGSHGLLTKTASIQQLGRGTLPQSLSSLSTNRPASAESWTLGPDHSLITHKHCCGPGSFNLSF